MEIPELKARGEDFSYRIPGFALDWALAYAFGLGQEHASIGAESAVRMVTQSLAGRNLIRVVASHWVGCTEHIDSETALRITKTDYEG